MMWTVVHVQPSVGDSLSPSARRPAFQFDSVFAGLGAIALAAAVAALAARWDHSLSVDEPFTALAVGQSATAVLDTLRHDNTPITYLALKPWSRLVGDSEIALRSLMAFSYGVAVLATGLAGVLLAGARCGIIAALLMASSGSVGLLHAATIRPYALLSLFSALAAYQLVVLLHCAQPATRLQWIGLTATHVLGLFTHPIYVFLALGASVAAWTAGGSRHRSLATSGIAALAIYAATWGWMIKATLQLPTTAWLTAPGVVDLWNAYLGIWGNRNGFLLAGALLALLTASGGARRLRENHALEVVALAAAFAFLGPFLMSFVKPVFHPTRTPTLALPFIALTAAAILSTLGSRLLAAVLGVSLALAGVQHVVASRRHGDPDPTRQSMAAILAKAQCGDVLISAGLSYAAVAYYFDRLHAPSCVSHQTFPREMSAHPGWLDEAAFARNADAYQAEAAALAEHLANTSRQAFAFTKRRGTGADVGEMLSRELATRLHYSTTLDLRGAFFDQVMMYEARSVK